MLILIKALKSPHNNQLSIIIGENLMFEYSTIQLQLRSEIRFCVLLDYL